jgi:hypothetical protein
VARPVRAGIVWPTAKAVGRGGARGAEPRQGRHSSAEIPYVAPHGASVAGNISNPSAVALGHPMAALTGLFDADTDTLSYFRNRVLRLSYAGSRAIAALAGRDNTAALNYSLNTHAADQTGSRPRPLHCRFDLAGPCQLRATGAEPFYNLCG